MKSFTCPESAKKWAVRMNWALDFVAAACILAFGVIAGGIL